MGWHYQASCEGKQGYPSRRLAAEALKRTHGVRDFIGKDRERFNVYACDHCGQFHLGRMSERSVDMAAKEIIRDPFKKRRKPSKDEAFYREWSAKRTFCYACGHAGDWLPLETHHIIKPGRAHEACNLIRLCHRDHCLAEGLDVREAGKLLPKLTIGMCLSLKLMFDEAEYDADRLQELRGSRLPDQEPVPPYFTQLYLRNRGAA